MITPDSILFGDCRESLRQMAAQGLRAQTCITSPPYFGLRAYLADGHADKGLEIGTEKTPEVYVAAMVEVFRCVRDVLADDGTLWLNIGDSYNNSLSGTKNGIGSAYGRTSDAPGHDRPCRSATGVRRTRAPGIKAKDLIGIPWMLAFALRADGWFLRQEIIWAKGTSGSRREGNVMPESVRDRCTKAHETIFLLSKRPRYHFDADAIKEPAQDWGTRERANFRGGTDDPKLKHHGLKNGSIEMGNRRSVWRVNPTPYKGAHFATFPPALIEPCVLAGSRPGDIVLDPFMGSGTTAAVAVSHGRRYLGCELNPEYAPMQAERITQARAKLAAVAAPPKARRAPAPSAPCLRQAALFPPHQEPAASALAPTHQHGAEHAPAPAEWTS